MLLCFSIWLSFDVVTIMTGTIIRVRDTALAVQPEVTYVATVVEYLPVVAKGLFIVGILGAIDHLNFGQLLSDRWGDHLQ